MNVIDYFDQVRIINMAKRQDRRDGTQAEFDKYQFPLNTDKVSFFKAIAPTEAKGFPNPGVRGCFLSHVTIIQEARQAGVGHVFVLEDDIQFSKHISSKGTEAVAALDKIDWDIAYIGHDLKSKEGPFKWLTVDQPMLLSHCYAVNARVFDRIIDFFEQLQERPTGHPDGGPMHYDGALNTFRAQNPDVKVVYASMNLGFQRPSATDLHSQSSFDKNPLLRPLTIQLRKLKAKYLSLVR